jgi:iron transport multicopper oxidase
MLSSTTTVCCFVWALLTQRIAAGGSDAYGAWGNSYGGHRNGWSSRSSSTSQHAMSSTKTSSTMKPATGESTDPSVTDVKPSSSWQGISTSSWTTVTAATPSISSAGLTTSSSTATSAVYPATNSSVSETSVSPSKTGTALTSHASSTTGNTVTYDWNIEWMIAAPDGFARPVIGVNGQWYVQLLAQTWYV